MSISNIGSGATSAYSPYFAAKKSTGKTGNAATGTGSTSKAVQEFLAYAHMSPAERIRAAYLKSHNLTEEELAAKSPEEREKIEDEIKREIEEKLKRETENKALKINIVV